MKATPDDPRLSAYLLGELSPGEAEDIRRQVAADPALRMSLDDLSRTLGILDRTFGGERDARLLPAQRDLIRRAARDESSRGKVVELGSTKRPRNRWLAALGAAAAVMLAAMWLSRLAPDAGAGLTDQADPLNDEIALLAMPGPSAGGGATRVGSQGRTAEPGIPQLDDRPGEFLSKVARYWEKQPVPRTEDLPPTGTLGDFDGGPVTRLPLMIGRSSLGWVTRWVRERRQLPPRDAVRIEEMVNQAVLSGGEEIGGLVLAIELMPCPWDRESTLVGVQLVGGDETLRQLKLVFRSGARRRVIGSFGVRADDELPTVLPPHHRTLVLLELKETESQFGGIEVHHGDKVGMCPVPEAGAEVSEDMRHAALLAGFGLWLRDEGVATEVLAGMLAEAGVDSDPVRSDLRRTIGEALKLAETKR